MDLPDEQQPDMTTVSYYYHDVEPDSVKKIPVDPDRAHNVELIRKLLQE